MDELFDETIQGNEEIPMENQESGTDSPPSDIPSNEVVEDVPETSDNVSQDENIADSSVIADETGSEDETGGETGSVGYSLSSDGSSVDGYDLSEIESVLGNIDSNITEFFNEIRFPETVNFWEMDISKLSTTDTLLFMIFLILLVQFVHNIFKGSHWFRR